MLSKDQFKSTCYIFNCPVHGYEEGTFCFRAFDIDNRYRWLKYIVRYERIRFEESELDLHLDSISREKGVST